MAEVLLYLIRLDERPDIDLVDVAGRTMRINARRYPIAKARSSSRKYTEL